MERTKPAKVIIDINGWKDIKLEDDFLVPTGVFDREAFYTREKYMRFINEHPHRIYHYWVGDQEYTIDCKCSQYLIRKLMGDKGASEEDMLAVIDISDQFRVLYGKLTAQTKRAFLGKSQAGGVLESKSEELLDLFGRLYTIEEVHQIVIQDWGFHINKVTLSAFYNRNLKEIEALRNKYALDFSDVTLTKKRSRLDKLSVMFYTYFNKWSKDNRLEYARELRALIEQIRKEVEGEQININVQGKIDVDLTLEVNKTLNEAYQRVPVNNLILAMVAAKRGIDPTKIMAQLTSSYYKALTGYGPYQPEVELVHPVDLTYNWNDIQRKHRMKDKSVLVEDIQIVETTGTKEADAAVLNVKNKLMELLAADKQTNERRKSK